MIHNSPNHPKLIQYFCTVFFSVCGLTLLFCSLFIPPHGEIHPSVLAAFGMILTFVGTTLGIDYNYRFKYFNSRNNSSKDNSDQK